VDSVKIFTPQTVMALIAPPNSNPFAHLSNTEEEKEEA
jgi:hypothetical protein